ncbi:MAG: stage III sporulation protein AG [Lachnospiraceae bacterium]|nr:stage III sporulation protein AG [Lachnospiraceae bacterium]
MGTCKEWLVRKGWDKWFQKDNLIILILVGVLLFIINLPTEKVDVEASRGLSMLEQNVLQGKDKQADTEVLLCSDIKEDYASYLEKRLQKVLQGVADVGKTEVMITLQSTEELVVEKDEPISRSDTSESDSAGGSRSVSQYESNETTIYSTDGSSSEPYVVKRIFPEVEGVLVVAQGADNGDINKSITEIVQALFDVEAHKVKVVKMKTN